MNKLFLAICFLAISIPTAAQTTLIQADGYINVENGELVTPASIVVEDGVITAINPSTLPVNAEVIDLQSSILLPGFMDMHVHLTVDFDGSWDYIGRESGSKGAIRGAINARKTLMAGFTTVRDVGQLHLTKELINVSLAQAVEEGVTEGPRIIAAGHMISITGGHGDPAMSLAFPEGWVELTPEYGIVNSADDAIAAVRYQIKHGAKVIKMHATAGVLSAEKSVGAQQLSDEEMRAIIEEASRHEMPVAAHAHGTEGMKAAIRAGVSSIEHGSMLDEEAIRMMIDNNVFLVPTTGLTDHIDLETLPPLYREKAELVLPQARTRLSDAIDAGVKIALGSDSPIIPHGENGFEIVAMTERGMTPAQALQSATMIPAQLLRMQDTIGQIKVGMVADIIAVKENPLVRIETVQDVIFVMKEGVIYKQAETD